jgi:hypothetical protein
MLDRKLYSGYINKLNENEIFVFGSNPEGLHGKGAARIALNKFGAIYRKGRGLQGQSYGLVTKNLRQGYYESETGIYYDKYGKRSVSKEQIIQNINELYMVARHMKNYEFYIAYKSIGGNLNGYTSEEMAEMFLLGGKKIPRNIIFEDNFYCLINMIMNKVNKLFYII